jgi:serine/threonine-protein kinase
MPQPLLQRFKERKVVQWVLAYLAGAFVVLQALDPIAQAWNLSDFIQQVVQILLVLGFFAALVLAWYHGEKGRQHVCGPELAMLALLVVVAGSLLATLGPPYDAGGTIPVEREDERPVIAVLPLDNLSPDPNDAYFAGGVQEELTSKLGRIPSIAVRPRAYADSYKDSELSGREIAAELGADYLVEGSARIGGDSVWITVQLIAGESDVHVWADDFSAPWSVEDYVQLQKEIVQQIAFHLRSQIAPDDLAWLNEVPTQSREAWELYLRGLDEFASEGRGVLLFVDFPSRRLFQAAVERDPQFALAHAHLALSLSYTQGGDPEESARLLRLRQAAERALELAGEVPEARIALARYHRRPAGEDDLAEALRQLQLAQKVAPHHPILAHNFAELQILNGDDETALATIEEAERLNPRDPYLPRLRGETLMFLHRFDEALQAFADQAARTDLRVPSRRSTLMRARIHLLLGQREAAQLGIDELLAESPQIFYGNLPWNMSAVLLRLLTPEQRQAALDAYTVYYTEEGWRDDCGIAWGLCLRRAIHETDVGSPVRARAVWDSLRAGKPEIWHSWWVSMGLGDREAGVASARAMVATIGGRDACRSRGGNMWCVNAVRALAHFGSQRPPS